VAQLPRYPDGENDPGIERHGGATKPSKKTYAFVIIGVALVLLMVILHLAGVVGPGSN
jgi:hypothetical protein